MLLLLLLSEPAVVCCTLALLRLGAISCMLQPRQQAAQLWTNQELPSSCFDTNPKAACC
jgi:hypothetical protein